MADILLIDDQTRTLELCRRVMPSMSCTDRHAAGRTRRHSSRRSRAGSTSCSSTFTSTSRKRISSISANPQEKDVRRARRRQGIEILQALRKAQPELPVVLMTSRGEIAGLSAPPISATRSRSTPTFSTTTRSTAGPSAGRSKGSCRRGAARERDGAVYWGRSLTMRRIPPASP